MCEWVLPLFPNSRLSLESILGVFSRNSQRGRLESCDLQLFCVGFNSVPNLIVILFNLMYLVFYVGFICKGCVYERECEDLRQSEEQEVFAGSLQEAFSWSDACAQHMTRMRRVRIGWWQLVFASVLWVRPSRVIPAKHFVSLICHIWHTLSLPIIYILPLPTNVEEFFSERKP